MSVVWAGWIAYNATLIALTVGVVALVIRDHLREKAEAAAEANADEAAVTYTYLATLVEFADETPPLDQTHPWVAERLLAHELEDDEAVARWLR
jgi:hypothetical protein